MKLKIVFTLLIVILHFSTIRSQESTNIETSTISIPPNIESEVVRRILLFNFKSPKDKRVVLLAKKTIDSSWLPTIPNIEFKLLSDEEAEDSEKDIYFFTKIELEKTRYSIGFAFGDPGCNYSSDIWNFYIENNKLSSLQANGLHRGAMCFGRNFKIPGELNKYPNELRNYEFFDKGKLNRIKLTVSTKEDVKQNFGSDCESTCEYDDKWTISFTYFGSMTKETTVDKKKIKYVPREDLLGKLYSIQFTPKNRVSFSRISFPSKFRESNSYAVGHGWDSAGNISSAVSISYKTFLDRFGLIYTVFDKTNYSRGKTEKDHRRNGDLMSIEYTIPTKTEETMFVEQKTEQ